MANLLKKHFRHRLFIQSPLRTKAFSIGGIDGCIPIPHFTLASSLRWRILDIAHPYESQQPIQMPFLKLYRNVIRNHPVINKLRCNRFLVTSGLLIFNETSCSHWRLDIRIDGGIVSADSRVYTSGSIFWVKVMHRT